MSAKIVLVLCALIALVSSVPAQPGPGIGAWGGGALSWGGLGAGAWGPYPGIPPWVANAPWFPKWVSCTAVGSACVDCNTKIVCFAHAIGGFERACTDPTLPYCNAGECSATPAAGCRAPDAGPNDAVAPHTIAAV